MKLEWYHWAGLGYLSLATLNYLAAQDTDDNNPNPSDTTYILTGPRNEAMNYVIKDSVKSHSLLDPVLNPKAYKAIEPHFTAKEFATKKGGLPENRALWYNIATAIAFCNDLRLLTRSPVNITPGGLFGGTHVRDSEHYQFSAIDFETSSRKHLNCALALAESSPKHHARYRLGFGTYKTFCHVDGGTQYTYPRRWTSCPATIPNNVYSGLPWFDYTLYMMWKDTIKAWLLST